MRLWIGVAVLMLGMTVGRSALSQPAPLSGETVVPVAYKTFLMQLREAIRTKQRHKVADLVRYPLRVNSAIRGKRQYRNRAELLAAYDKVFNQPLRLAILQQDPNAIFRNYRGASIADGALWFEGDCLDKTFDRPLCENVTNVRIIAVNPW